MDNVTDLQKESSILQTQNEKIKVAISDMDGVLRGKYMHREKLESALKGGFGFCSVVFGWDCNDVCYDNTKLSGWHNGYPDTLAQIDLSTKRHIPWEQNTQFYLADFVHENGDPLAICPRQVLKKQIQFAHELGYKPMFGLEFEWFNFKENPQSLVDKNFHKLDPITPGMFGYSLLRSGQNQKFFHTMIDCLQNFDVPLEGIHTETGPGVLEGAICVSDALSAADRAILFKSSVKELAYLFGITATFMAKWNNNLPGCSGHMHQSLWDKNENKNVFHEEKNSHKRSEIFEHYLAGQALLMPELMPFYAPNVNSYKRLVEGFWAPTSATWGVDNRTCALRVIPGSKKSTRLETRVSGSDINPYLSVAAALGSGLYGVKNKLKLKQPQTKGNAYLDQKAEKLPKTLREANEIMTQSKIAREIFGDEFIDHFSATRNWEVRQYEQSVTDFELKRYFEII